MEVAAHYRSSERQHRSPNRAVTTGKEETEILAECLRTKSNDKGMQEVI